MQKDQSLAGKVAVVTGGNKGIGRAIAVRLAAQGASVMIGARHAAQNHEAVAEIAKAGGHASSVEVDLRHEDGPARLIAAAHATYGGLDILVNNAGDTKFGDFEMLTDEDFQSGFGLKYYSAVRSARAAWPLLKASKGVMINISGVGGRVPMAGFTIGSSVNAAIQAFTKAMADAGIPHGVRVLCVNPASVETDRLRASVADWAEKEGISYEARLNRIAADSRMLRVGQPEDVAGIVAFLASEDASWMTGSLIDVDGGAVKSL